MQRAGALTSATRAAGGTVGAGTRFSPPLGSFTPAAETAEPPSRDQLAGSPQHLPALQPPSAFAFTTPPPPTAWESLHGLRTKGQPKFSKFLYLP